jgi:hypothetical protein
MQTHTSEVAHIREEIAAQYLAAKLGLQGLNAGTARHSFMTAKQERIGVLHEKLQDLVGDEAITLVVETLTDIPDTATRSGVLIAVRYELDNDEERARFCDHLQAAWKAVDLVQERFGEEQARKLIFAPSSVRDIPPS